MKVARLHGVGDIQLTDEREPEVPSGHSLVRITAVGLCGSDLHWYSEGGIGDARIGRPLVVGHESAGVIEGGPRHGEAVAVDPAIPCGVVVPPRDGENECRVAAIAHVLPVGFLGDDADEALFVVLDVVADAVEQLVELGCLGARAGGQRGSQQQCEKQPESHGWSR